MTTAARPTPGAAAGNLDLRVVRSRAELEALRGELAARVEYERLICDALRDREQWTLPIVCQVCERAVAAAGDWQFSDGQTINFRERLTCPGCELNNRQRFMAHQVVRALEERRGPASVYLYEQVTPFFAWAERSLAAEVVGSEYLGHEVAGGAVIEGVRHEDALALTFEDDTFDIVVSNDVYEHVPDIVPALAECVRVLKPGGRMLFSIPFHYSADVTVKRAELRDGRVEELLPAQYHGNPISTGGSLVFYDHGWDVFDRCRDAGFRDVWLMAYWSPLCGYLGDGIQMMFVADA